MRYVPATKKLQLSERRTNWRWMRTYMVRLNVPPPAQPHSDADTVKSPKNCGRLDGPFGV
jgi:hypothetical protein